MRAFIFAKRNIKEIFRDPLNLIFGLLFPAVLILVMGAIGKKVPADLFDISSLAPGMTVFGLSFLTLFSATLIAKDRESAFFSRLLTSPMTAADFIMGYILPLLPVALLQGIVCFISAVPLGLEIKPSMLLCLLLLLPCALFFLSVGLLAGSLLNLKAVGGLCGALLTNLTAFFSNIWIDVDMIGGWFAKFARLMPFIHSADLIKDAYAGNYGALTENLIWVLLYSLVFSGLACLIFLRKMKKN